MYLQSAVEDGCIGEILLDRGFRFTNDPSEISTAEAFVSVKVSEGNKAFPIRVPIGLLMKTA
jgi:hypothetical protein